MTDVKYVKQNFEMTELECFFRLFGGGCKEGYPAVHPQSENCGTGTATRSHLSHKPA